MQERLSGKTIIVTGGCGLLGQTFCKGICENGGNVVIADRNLSKAAELEGNINKSNYSGKAFAVEVDITSAESLKKCFEKGIEKFASLDGLINSAYPRNAKFGAMVEDITYESFVDNVSIHLGGYFLATKEFVSFIKPKDNVASIINISSVYGVIPPRFDLYKGTKMTNAIEYGAIKAGIIHLAKYFSKYYADTKIRFNCVCPGGIFDNQPEQFLERYKHYCKSKGMLDPNDILGAVIFLLSDESKYVTGQNLIVDDGFCL